MGGFLQTLMRIGPARLVLIAAVTAGMIGFFAYLGNRFTQPDYGLLYGDLDMKDSGQVATKLDALGVPYQVRPNGAIYVPVDQVGRMRLAMAEIGIPHGGSIGYEIFDKSDLLGATSFQQGINEMRALEGELARTIQSLSAVESARVHLVLPKRELFSRDAQEPSASVVLQTRRADSLGKGQVAAILNLVASAVPGLKTDRIAIVDQSGNLLARGGGAAGGAGALGESSLEEQRANYESQLSRSVEDMLERSIGFGRVRADVNVDMDLDRLTTTQETYDPSGQVARSTQTTSETDDSTQTPQDSSVSVQSNLPAGAQTQQPAAQPNRSKTSKSEETTNFEISKKISSETREPGSVKRLTVAVLVDGTYTTNDKGERVYQPRTADELSSITKLVQTAIGYDEKRGDRVEVVNMRFAIPDDGGLAEAPPFSVMGLGKPDLFRIGEMAVAFIVAVLLIFLVLRPLVQRSFRDAAALAAPRNGQLSLAQQQGQAALPAPDGMGGNAMVPVEEQEEETMIDVNQIEGGLRASSMRKIGEIVDKHPEEAVSVIRTWMYQS